MPEPKSSSGYRVGIVNPLTLVGSEIKAILRDRAFPFSAVVLLDSTGNATGALTEVGDEPAVVAPITSDTLEDLDLAFFCGPSESNREWIERHDADHFAAIDVSQPTTTDGGRLAVAGINLEEISAADRLLVSPHPVAIPLALVLRQIALLSPIEICTATVVQPASEFEQEGVEELARQTMSVLNVNAVPQLVFDRQLAFNLYPALARQEEFILGQVKSLLRIHDDSSPDIALLITQGTIFHSHTFSLFVRTRDSLDSARLAATLAANPAIILPEGDQQFGTIDAAGKDEVLIAEIRPDPSIHGGFWIWAVCDNLRRSSALNAVLVAEKVLFGTATN